ncbi:MAG: M48 family metalloprotease [Lentisphaerae bacterium]|nr:M48 family metalloprotease [Lentisphaerota bacterium]
MNTLYRAIVLSLSALALAGLSGCQSVGVLSEVGAGVAAATGAVTPQQAESIKRAGVAVGKTFEDITPEQEYYIGRTVGAVVLNRYKPLNNEAANHYLNVLGQTLAQFSDRPETFGGYHFLVMETEEVNAFSAPGGLIFISRGMLRCCRSEDALAAVLAHEIAHVAFQHGLRAIKKGRLTSALTILAAESAKSLGGQDLAQLTEAFEGSIGDITATMMNNGYARGFERQADQAAVTILQRAGYDPQGLAAMLTEMQERLKPGGVDFAKTHPSPKSRIEDIVKWIGPVKPVSSSAERQARFQAALGKT